jgi:hypothetical protein
MSEHWLQHAHGRIVAGDDELDVMADYGWVQITAEEREAIKTAVGGMCLWMKENEVTEDESLRRRCATLRNLLERLHT